MLITYPKGRQAMDGQTCDKHPSARAAARIMFPNLSQLYLCRHCADAFGKAYTGDYHIAYEGVTV